MDRSLPVQMARHLREVYFGGNWTVSNLRDQLKGVTWQQATTQVHSLNTIATLVYHIAYYVDALLGVLEGDALTAKDEYSFNHPPIQSMEDWETMLDKVWADADSAASLIERMPESKFWSDFTDQKYGPYYRNIQGTIEHTHYHLGQIALLKRIVQQGG
jgi:hypothetical protein